MATDKADLLNGTDGADFISGLGGNDWINGYGGNDLLKGGGGVDVLNGGTGNDILNGGEQADLMIGGLGDDTYIVNDLNDGIMERGGQGSDRVLSSVSYVLRDGADVELLATSSDAGTSAIYLIGNSSGNEVRGNNGDNSINGGGGADQLTGLGGRDGFVFDTPLGGGNIDTITDFYIYDDVIVLDAAIFDALLGVGGWVAPGEFVIGPAALDANDRLIYNSASGALFYDSDGAGGTAAVQFATLDPGLALTHLHFNVLVTLDIPDPGV
jgi:Ca2+-binding RTX toxin-like protein